MRWRTKNGGPGWADPGPRRLLLLNYWVGVPSRLMQSQLPSWAHVYDTLLDECRVSGTLVKPVDRGYFPERFLSRLLRIRDRHREIGLGRARRDGAVLVDAKIEVAERAADRVRGAAAAEDRPAEIVVEGISCPVSAEYATRNDLPPVADHARHRSGVIVRETRIEPLEAFPGDRGVGQRERCVPGGTDATGPARVAQMRREDPRCVGVLDVVTASARCGAIARPVEGNCRHIERSIPVSGGGE